MKTTNIVFSLFLVILLVFAMSYQKLESYSNSDYVVAKSKIAGQGVFLRVNKPANTRLFPVITRRKVITTLGSKINHCTRPNTALRHDKDGWYVESLRALVAGEELTVDYRTAPSFVQQPKPNWVC